MSFNLVSQIWENRDRRLTGTKLVIMLCLADHANDDGECWPSIGLLADRARITPANVTRRIKQLEAAGYLTVTRTRGLNNLYLVSAAPRAKATLSPGHGAARPSRSH